MSVERYLCVSWTISVCQLKDICVSVERYLCVSWTIFVCQLNDICVSVERYLCVSWTVSGCQLNDICVSVERYLCVSWTISVCQLNDICETHYVLGKVRFEYWHVICKYFRTLSWDVHRELLQAEDIPNCTAGDEVDLAIAVSCTVQIFCVENIVIAWSSWHSVQHYTKQNYNKKKESYALNIELHFSVYISFISWKPVLMKPQFYCNHIIKFIPWITMTQFTCRSTESEWWLIWLERIEFEQAWKGLS